MDKALTSAERTRSEMGRLIELRNPGELADALEMAVTASRRMADELANADFKGPYCDKCKRRGLTVHELAKSASYVAKMVDQIARLLEFAKGNADSRQEVTGLGDLLKVLSDDQFRQVCAWIDLGRQPRDVTPHVGP